MPKQRRLTGEEKENIVNMLNMKSNKKLLQHHIKNTVGKNVLLKDLHNIASTNNLGRKNNFEELLKEMKQYHSKFCRTNLHLGKWDYCTVWPRCD